MADPYPQSPCPFCAIASAFPSPPAASTPSPGGLNENCSALHECIPENPNSDLVQPNAHVVLAAPDVVAFLDVMPMTAGHLLVASRAHREKVEDLDRVESMEVGFWLPLIARAVANVVGVTDYNIVQNNGIRAAQVIPHVHFHIIPRPGTLPTLRHMSWRMFGRGQREDLDDDEGAALAGHLREALRAELDRRFPNEGKPSSKL
ncbi:HIT-like domain-containing protein [Lineolata rhizophorae]|uniref:HIT-like domain-containing protein n=1 Tax=Lineolata rhizophorae TaxID=578093 RepID=A0A6A6NL37_9PEZI|nr:HIT-like domain-containing protein [Lineolata rhizophorae]